MKMLKSVVRSTLKRRFNRVLVPYTPDQHFEARLLHCIKSQSIDCVLDVGANLGLYAQTLFGGGFQGHIVSFEPIGALHAGLRALARSNARWMIADRCALGAAGGEVDLHVAGNRASTSVLEMSDRHREASPEAATVSVERTPVRRLDEIGPVLVGDARRIFMKLDVQGFEPQVLEGAEGLLPRICGLQVEMSLAELYKGQTLFRELLDRILAMGFEMWGFDPVFTDIRTGRTLQVDGIFFRPENMA